MTIFSSPSFSDHEQVVFCADPDTGLKAIIAVHDTTLGPALGGTRMWAYDSEQDAIEDALRLSRGMTYKSAISGLDLGGGKSVIIGDSRTGKSEALFESFGRFLEGLGGRYIAAEDVGTSVADLEVARRSTRHVAGITEGGAGDPSPATAWGVYSGICAAVRHKLGTDDLTGLRVAVQGLGNVGFRVCRHLRDAGAELIVTDIYPDSIRRAVDELQATAVEPDEIVGSDVDVFAPCALGAVIDDAALDRLKAPIVAGAANNQLAEPRHGQALLERGILYAPDYVINAGGIILISHEGPAFERSKAMAHVEAIRGTLLDIFKRAEREGLPTSTVADRMAEERIAAAKGEKEKEAVALAG